MNALPSASDVGGWMGVLAPPARLPTLLRYATIQ